MKITFLGTGTSQGIPVIACSCDVCISTNPKDNRLRTSILVENRNDCFVIDTGPDFRQQMLNAKVKKLDAALFTHEHKDHLGGLDDIRAFNFVAKKPMDIYATERVQKAIRNDFAYAFSNSKYPGIPQLNLISFDNDPFFIGETNIIPINVTHFRLPVKAFRINNFTYITDANEISETEKEKIKGSEIIVINALQKEPHVSHFTFDEAVNLMHELKPKKAYFTHISHRLGLHATILNELPSFIELAHDGLQLEI